MTQCDCITLAYITWVTLAYTWKQVRLAASYVIQTIYMTLKNSVNQCKFTCITVVPDFIPIWSITMEPEAFLKRPPQQQQEQQQDEYWVAMWDQLLSQTSIKTQRERERDIYKSQETWLFMMARRHLTPIWMSSFKSPKFHFVWKDLERCGRDGRLREEPRCNEFTTDFEVSKEPLVESFNLDRFHITTRMCDRAPPDGLAGSKLWS